MFICGQKNNPQKLLRALTRSRRLIAAKAQKIFGIAKKICTFGKYSIFAG